jgi:hypothetical protein
MYEDMGPIELLDLANQAEDMARGLMQKAMDLRVQARNKQVIMRTQGAKTWGATVRPYVLIDEGASE